VIEPSALRNASNYPNNQAFATLQADGSITAWGDLGNGGAGAPTDSGYTKIYSFRQCAAIFTIFLKLS
jgi:hypothetical protein